MYIFTQRLSPSPCTPLPSTIIPLYHVSLPITLPPSNSLSSPPPPPHRPLSYPLLEPEALAAIIWQKQFVACLMCNKISQADRRDKQKEFQGAIDVVDDLILHEEVLIL